MKQAAGDRLKILLTPLTANRFLVASADPHRHSQLVLRYHRAGGGFCHCRDHVLDPVRRRNHGPHEASAAPLQLSFSADFNVTAVGIFHAVCRNNRAMRHWGMMLMGLGLVFYGMGVMGDAMKPLHPMSRLCKRWQR